jgi:hypothetical protein
MTAHAAALEPAAAPPRSDALPDRPPISAPPPLQAPDVRESVREVAARQPALGLAGLLLVALVAVLLGIGAGGLERSLKILGPLSTFALPVVAMIAFWWEDWPGTRLQAPLSGLLDTVLVVIGALILTLLGQFVVGHLDLRGVPSTCCWSRPTRSRAADWTRAPAAFYPGPSSGPSSRLSGYGRSGSTWR